MVIDDPERFKNYLRGLGCRISRPKTQWEFMRYRCPVRGLQIVHVNKKGIQKVPKVAQQHWRAYEKDRDEHHAFLREMAELMSGKRPADPKVTKPGSCS